MICLRVSSEDGSHNQQQQKLQFDQTRKAFKINSEQIQHKEPIGLQFFRSCLYVYINPVTIVAVNMANYDRICKILKDNGLVSVKVPEKATQSLASLQFPQTENANIWVHCGTFNYQHDCFIVFQEQPNNPNCISIQIKNKDDEILLKADSQKERQNIQFNDQLNMIKIGGNCFYFWKTMDFKQAELMLTQSFSALVENQNAMQVQPQIVQYKNQEPKQNQNKNEPEVVQYAMVQENVKEKPVQNKQKAQQSEPQVQQSQQRSVNSQKKKIKKGNKVSNKKAQVQKTEKKEPRTRRQNHLAKTGLKQGDKNDKQNNESQSQQMSQQRQEQKQKKMQKIPSKKTLPADFYKFNTQIRCLHQNNVMDIKQRDSKYYLYYHKFAQDQATPSQLCELKHQLPQLEQQQIKPTKLLFSSVSNSVFYNNIESPYLHSYNLDRSLQQHFQTKYPVVDMGRLTPSCLLGIHDNIIFQWDTRESRKRDIEKYKTVWNLDKIACVQNQNYYVTGAADGIVRTYDVRNHIKALNKFQMDEGITSLQISDTGSYILCRYGNKAQILSCTDKNDQSIFESRTMKVDRKNAKNLVKGYQNLSFLQFIHGSGKQGDIMAIDDLNPCNLILKNIQLNTSSKTFTLRFGSDEIEYLDCFKKWVVYAKQGVYYRQEAPWNIK